MTYFLETYGCQMNTAESAALTQVLKERGWTASASGTEADMVLLNTCSVRATAEQRALGRLAHYRALKKKRRGHPLTVVLAGCMAKRLGADMLKEGAADYILGPPQSFPALLDAVEGGGAFAPAAEEAYCFQASHLEEGRFRSFLPIMQGCNNFCSYCIVPYLRGPEISRSPAAILAELRLLGEKGVREVTLLGQNVNSYAWPGGEDWPESLDFPGLLDLIARECAGLSIGWVRFLSSHPKDLSGKTIEVMAANPVFCRHIHLCVQHGSNRVLAAMNRRYTREDYLGLVEKLKKAMPDLSLSTDILVGFPGETEEDLEETLDLMEKVKFLYAYMYHYNPREGTAAFNLPGRIDDNIKRRRLGRVIALQKVHTGEQLRSRLGRREKVLIEGISRKNGAELIARTERDEMAAVPGTADMIGAFGEVSLAGLAGNTFRGEDIRILS